MRERRVLMLSCTVRMRGANKVRPRRKVKEDDEDPMSLRCGELELQVHESCRAQLPKKITLTYLSGNMNALQILECTKR